MKSKIKIPDSCKETLLMQRCSEISKVYDSNWLSIFKEDIDELERCVKPRTKYIFDIGSGLGFVSFLLFERLNRNDIQFYLLDGAQNEDFTKENEVRSIYQHKHLIYNSFELSKEIIKISGLPQENFHFIDVNDWNYKKLPKMDIIFSFASWGFHYPIETYLEEASYLSKKGTFLLLDVCVDDRAGNQTPEQKVTAKFKSNPSIIGLNYGRSTSEIRPEIRPDHSEEFYQPVGKKLLAARFKWCRESATDSFEKDIFNINH